MNVEQARERVQALAREWQRDELSTALELLSVLTTTIELNREIEVLAAEQAFGAKRARRHAMQIPIPALPGAPQPAAAPPPPLPPNPAAREQARAQDKLFSKLFATLDNALARIGTLEALGTEDRKRFDAALQRIEGLEVGAARLRSVLGRAILPQTGTMPAVPAAISSTPAPIPGTPDPTPEQ